MPVQSRSPHPVLFCITELQVGGAERMLVELATRLDRERFSPAVLVLASERLAGQSPLAGRLREAEVPVTWLGGKRAFDAPRLLRRLVRELRQRQPAVLQTFLWHANTAGAVAARVAGVRNVVSGIRVAEHGRRMRHFATRMTAGRVARHVCVSGEVRDFACRKIGLPAERLAVIPNGVDPARFPSPNQVDLAELGIARGRRVLAFIGRLTRQKGADRLVWIAEQVLSRLPRHDLLIVGRGPLEPQLKWQAARCGVVERIHFAGFRPDVPDVLAATEMLLTPSRYEGMSNAILEAMATGLPVVTTRVEGTRALFDPGDTLQVVSSQDMRAFVESVVTIASAESLAQQLGRQNQDIVRERYGIDRMVESYQSLYESLLADDNALQHPPTVRLRT